MIVTKQKDQNTLLEYLKKDTALYIIGCSDCAEQCSTGGEKEVQEACDFFTRAGKKIVGSFTAPTLCHELHLRLLLREHKDEVNKADSILVYACGAGIQSVAETAPCPVRPACDSLFLGNIRRQMQFSRKCSLCGECTLNQNGGLCAVTRCSKGLMNGPCGGAKDGKCEINQSIDCIWVAIYDKLKEQGRLAELEITYPPKDYSVIINNTT